MKHIKIFDTVAHLNKFKLSQNYIKPNVSLCEDNPTTVYYDPYIAPVVPVTPQHDYVEIGGIKWATMNLGANNVTDPGLYFQWGDTQGYTAAQVGSGSGQKYFGWADYKYTNDGGTTMTNYNSTDGKTVLEASDDAVIANWGGSWRMPTKDEYTALGNAVNTAWTADYQGSGIAGMICTDKTDSSKVLFFPAAGYCDTGRVTVVGSWGYYWSSSRGVNYVDYAYLFRFDSYDIKWANSNIRCVGYPVRGVLAEN